MTDRQRRTLPRPFKTGLTIAVSAILAVACSGGEDSATRNLTAGQAAATTTTTTTVSTADDTTEAAEPAADPPTEASDADADAADLAEPTTVDEFAAAFDAAESAIRDPDLTSAERDAWGRRQQRLYRFLAGSPDLAPEIIAATDPALRDAVANNWAARSQLNGLVNSENLQTDLPAWRIVDPLPAETLLELYKQGEAEWGVPWEFLAGINLVETRMGRIEGVSTAGALGPMQFLPTTWAECCDGDPTDPADAIVGAAQYLTIRGGPEDMDRALWGYNNSDRYVAAVNAYAAVLMADEQAYHGYHAWEVYFRSSEGLIRIPAGYDQAEPIPARDWLADNPDDLLSN